MSPRIVLVGLPGSGKSVAGRALAGALGCGFVDVDDQVTALTGATPAAWLRERGEEAFRVAESAALARALSATGDLVVATGGGAVESASSRRLLAEEHVVVLLRCSPGVLAARLADGGDRPLVAEPTVERLGWLIERRSPLYAEVATAEVDADRPLDEVVDELAKLAAAT